MASEEADPILDEVRERFVLKKLEERCWRLEAENKDLRTHNSILNTQYNSQRETQSDILRQLNATIEDNYKQIEKAEATIQELQDRLEDQKHEAEGTLSAEREQWENKVKGLQTKCEELKNTLNEVREFQKQKDFMEGELQRLQHQLEEQSEQHSRDISAADRKKAMEIDMLKKDMHRSIRETRDMLRAKTKDQLDQTTKRTIMENEQKTTELHFQNKEAERLLSSNNKLLQENAQLKRNLQIHKDLENELAKRTHVYQKLIKKMEQQLNDVQAREQSQQLGMSTSLEHEQQSRTEVSRELPSVGPGAQQAVQVDTLKRQVERTESHLATVRHEFAQYKRDHATLTQLQDQSTRLIIAALYELKNQRDSGPFPPPSYDENADWQFATMTPKQKEYFFRVLLEKLNGSMCGNCFPTGSGHLGTRHSAASLPAIHRHEGETQAHFSQFLWSVASHGGQPVGSGAGRKDTSTKSVQTETGQSDPCLQEGLWNPSSRRAFGGTVAVSPVMVGGSVRTWGPKALSQKPTGLTGVSRLH